MDHIERSLVARWIGDARCGKSCCTYAAGIAASAGAPLAIRAVAGHGKTVVDAKLQASTDNIRLGPPDQRRVDLDLGALDTGFGRQACERLEGCNEFRSAIRIARIVDRIDAEENILRSENLCPGESQREHGGVAGRNVGDRDAALSPGLGYRDVRIRQGRS